MKKQDNIINVVAGIIKNSEGKILIAKRNLKKSQGGLYEFPGGKLEINETYEEALKREIMEELDLEIEVLNYFDEITYVYPERTIKLVAYNAKMLNNHYKVLEHEDVKFINKDEFNNYEFANADKYFVEKLKK